MTCQRALSFSVALATYNGAKFIRAQLDSIARQTYLPHEIVICDDASSDATLETIEAAKRDYEVNLRVYRNSNTLGFVKNFEKAISLCSGNIIALCDQDDIWLPTKLERIAQVFKHSPDCGLVFTDAHVVGEELAPMDFTVYSRYPKPDLRQENTLRSLLKDIGILGCTLAFRSEYRPCLLPFPSSVWGHDHWIVFVLAVVSRLKMVNEPLMYYRRHTAHAGNPDPLNRRFDQILTRMQRNLSFSAYQKSYQKWVDMLSHLELLHEHETTCCCDEDLAQGIAMTRQRLIFAQIRLQMRNMKRSRRLAPATRLWLSGAYHDYTPGSRTLLKDLLA